MLVVHCASHVCGLTSASIIARWGMLKRQAVRIGGVFAFSKMDRLHASKDERLMLCDIPFDRVVKFNTQIAYCSSHQEENEAVIAELQKRKIIFDKKTQNISCASLLAKRLLPHDGVAKLLGNAADSALCESENELAGKVGDILQAGFDPHQLISLWHKGVLWADHLEKFWADVLLKKQHAIEFLRKNIDVRKYLSMYIGFVRAPSVLSSRDAAKELLAAHSSVDVAVVIAHDGHVTFRAREDVDVLQIAKKFGGGGQVYASGAKIFDATSSDVINKLDEKIRLQFPSGLPRGV